mgnify:CR=1 FL=1
MSISLLKSTLVKYVDFFLLILELKTGNRLAQEILSQHAIDVNFAPINVYWRRMEVRVSSALANVTALYNGAIFFLKSQSNYHHPMQLIFGSLNALLSSSRHLFTSRCDQFLR